MQHTKKNDMNILAAAIHKHVIEFDKIKELAPADKYFFKDKFYININQETQAKF